MDDLVVLRVFSILTVNFLISFTVSNWLFSEVDLIKSSITSLKIFCSTYCLGHVILSITSAKTLALSSHSHVQQSKGIFIVSSVFKWFTGIVIFHCLAVLYGASISRNVEETFMWSILMSNLVLLPALLVGTDEIFKTLVHKRKCITLHSCLCTVMVLTLLGAWFGAFTLPLDWDRDWQVWPIPCAAGAMTGHLLGLITSDILLYWKYRNKDKNKFI